MQTINNNLTVLGVLDSNSVGDGIKKSINDIVTDRLDTAVRLLSEETDAAKAETSAQVQQLQEALNNTEERLRVAVENYNTAIQVINNMSARITALEANYDPTIIK